MLKSRSTASPFLGRQNARQKRGLAPRILEIRFRSDEQGRFSSILACGHAQWDKLGRDVVCAAVSTILQSVWVGLSEVALVAVEGERSAGYLRMAWPETARNAPDLRAIVATAEISIAALAAQYPANLRIVRERESGEAQA